MASPPKIRCPIHFRAESPRPRAPTRPLSMCKGVEIQLRLSNYPAPYVQQWNFDIQRQLPGNTLFDIAYAGSKGTHLPMHNQDLDQLPPAVSANKRGAGGGPDRSGAQSVLRSHAIRQHKRESNRKGSVSCFCLILSSTTWAWPSPTTGIPFTTRCN